MELYQSLYENTKNIQSTLDPVKKDYILQTIPKLDEKGHENIFFLIRMFNLQQVKELVFNIPYHSDGNTDANGIEFDLDKFPNHLQQMIYMFVRMHYEYISLESVRTI